ncbi:hypothetical protein D623_10016633 [Myotis brandtii]|uniref:Phosphofurin acidic cluster sorting protein 1/2 C-terminal domain-containing protein n=1 Tax=Myotis brandtii TaxID=109478 RepID=S7NWX7_MYOBR|nr:hypothetical protein D623_10016633 [Myotis brandtii]
MVVFQELEKDLISMVIAMKMQGFNLISMVLTVKMQGSKYILQEAKHQENILRVLIKGVVWNEVLPAGSPGSVRIQHFPICISRHSDSTFLPALETPSTGGPTCFSVNLSV